MDFTYKSYCWHLGTTSFRSSSFNKKVELQLTYLREFWNKQDDNETWSRNVAIQTEYYKFLHQKDFLSGDANQKAKDAREKTSGLVTLGLIDDQRRPTGAGQALLKIVDKQNFKSNNLFQIPADSYVYLKQLLKTSIEVSGKYVRPLIVSIYLLSIFEKLSIDQFTYLLPFCTSKANTNQIISSIENKDSIDCIIQKRLMGLCDYKKALKCFKKSKTVDIKVLNDVVLNRKSEKYNKPYLSVYNALHNICFSSLSANASDWSDLVAAIEKFKNSRLRSIWYGVFFNSTRSDVLKKKPRKYLKVGHPFENVKSENAFRTTFFKVLHLCKAKSLLVDYEDLNRRYLSITDIFIFEDDEVKLTLPAKYLFNSCINNLYKVAYKESKNLQDACDMQEIHSSLVFNEQIIIDGVNKEFKMNCTNIRDVNSLLDNLRYDRFKKLINTKFKDETLIELLSFFEKRDDVAIRKLVTNNADVPTIFEYILGVIWYKISNMEGKVLDYMKLSLDANLLPKTHAIGGTADIIYEYETCKDYSGHAMLLEATLSNNKGQRNMELEPVSRHLGEYLLKHENKEAYCVFITTSMSKNVASDFRNRKNQSYYDEKDDSRCVEGLKIIPVDTSVLSRIIKKNIKYNELYKKFNAIYLEDMLGYNWYKKYVETLYLD